MVFSPPDQERAHLIIEQMFAKEVVPPTLLFYGANHENILFFASLLFGNSTKIAQNNHPDFHLYYPDEKSNLHSMQTIKEMLQEMKLPPFEGTKKLFVIYEADAMLPSSSNALLKALEESHEDTYTILVTHHLEKILPTIRSRSRLLSFFSTKEENLKQASYASTLIEILKNELYLDYLVFFKTLAELERQFDESQEIDSILTLLLYWYRDVALLKSNASPELLYYPEHLDVLGAQKMPRPLEKIFAELSLAKEAYGRGVKLRTLLTQFFLKR